MVKRTPWFDGSLIGAVFALIVTPAAADIGMLLVNLVALGCFVAPVVAEVRESRAEERRVAAGPASGVLAS